MTSLHLEEFRFWQSTRMLGCRSYQFCKLSVLFQTTLFYILLLIVRVEAFKMLSIMSRRTAGCRALPQVKLISFPRVARILLSTQTAGVPSATFSPIKLYVSVDQEILAHLKIKQRKTRILISTKFPSTVQSIRAAIENKFKSLSDSPYKLRYRLAQAASTDLLPLKTDEDIDIAINGAVSQQSSLQMFVQVNPGIFPGMVETAEGNTVNEKTTYFYSHQESVDAMRAAHVDPADCDAYTMVSFYGFRDIEDPAGFALQLEHLWQPFLALGRVYVATEGINAQMAVPSNVLPYFSTATRSLPMFSQLRINIDKEVSREEFMETKPFKALHVRARDQILSDGFSDVGQINGGSSASGTAGGGALDWGRAGSEMHPLEWHRRLSEHDAAGAHVSTEPRPIVLDCRNSYESEVGLFESAVPLNTTFFRESWPVLDGLLRSVPKDAPILTYCTGGIRCVKVNAYLQQKLGFTNTHRLQGGIIAYNRELAQLQQQQQSAQQAGSDTQSSQLLPTQSKFRGVNYVFDERIAARITEDVLTVCELCADTCDQFTNCANHPCNVRFIQCPKCSVRYSGCCSKACQMQHAKLLASCVEAAPSSSTSRRKVAPPPPPSQLLSRSAQRKIKTITDSPEAASAAQDIPSPVSVEHAFNNRVADLSGPGLMEALTDYCAAHSVPETPLLAQLRQETLTHYAAAPGAARMLSDPLQGRVLALLVSITDAKNILELGAFTGYSAICLAQALDAQNAPASKQRKVITCEPDAVARGIAQKYISIGQLEDVIDLRPTKATDVIESLRAADHPLLDIVFLDADKKQYRQYLQMLMGDDASSEGDAAQRPLLREGALLVVDNTLWKGLVLECGEDSIASSEHDAAATPRMRALAAAMHSFNAYVAAEPRLQPVMLPLRDGLSIIRYSP